MQMTSDMKRCVTCGYWAGERKVGDDWGKSVEYDGAAKAKCYIKAIADWDMEAGDGAMCDKYEKWKALKQD